MLKHLCTCLLTVALFIMGGEGKPVKPGGKLTAGLYGIYTVKYFTSIEEGNSCLHELMGGPLR